MLGEDEGATDGTFTGPWSIVDVSSARTSGVCTETMSGATQLLPGALVYLVCQKTLHSQSGGVLGYLGSAVRNKIKFLVVRLSSAGSSL